MKILLIIILILATGCNKEIKKEKNLIEKIEINEKEDINEETKEEYVDTNPIKIGLYQKNKLIKEMKLKYKDNTDIGIFDAIFTTKQILETTKTKTNFNKYYKEYNDIEKYKIGYEVSFYVGDKLYENIMLDPTTQHKLTPYLYLYLYDDIHVPDNTSYSHITPNDVKDNTVYTSIKLYLYKKSNEITSDIKLKVFTYLDENDFIDSHYRGNSYYEIKIEKI